MFAAEASGAKIFIINIDIIYIKIFKNYTLIKIL